jgi:lysophospholipase L1-like esterase
LKARDLVHGAALSAASLLIVLGLLEAGVRLLVPPEQWRFIEASDDWQLDPELGWVNKPDLDVESRFGGDPIRFRTNPDGLIPASAARAKPPGVLRVMIFGDSMVVGRRLPQDRIYTARLEALLRERGIRADVINAGVQGYSTDQVLLLMQRWLPVYRPDVVLYGSTFNDFGGNALDFANGHRKPRFTLDPHGRLQLHPPGAADEVPADPIGLRNAIQHWALYRLLQPRVVVLRARFFGFDERVLLGLYDEAYVRPEFADRFDWRLFAALLRQIDDTARSSGARFLFFAHPELSEVWDPYIDDQCRQLGIPRSRYDPHAMERRLVEAAAQSGVDFVPMIEAFRSRQDRGPFHLLPERDPHLGAAGHELLAELLTDALAARSGPGRLDPRAMSAVDRAGPVEQSERQ